MPPRKSKGKAPATKNAEEAPPSNIDDNGIEQHKAVEASGTSIPTLEAEQEGSDHGATILDGSSRGVEPHNNNADESSKTITTGEAPLSPEETAPLPAGEQIPPLPAEEPPLPSEPLPAQDDGWEPLWEPNAQAFYFYNRFTQATQWDNPRVPVEAAGPLGVPAAPGTTAVPSIPSEAPPSRPAGGYDPAIHGDYDPTAWYAQPLEPEVVPGPSSSETPVDPYAATGAFNRFTGRWQAAEIAPENFNDENKSKRQMNAFFDVDAAANSHDGRSLKAERSGKKLSRSEVKGFKEKRKQRKEEKRRAWLLD